MNPTDLRQWQRQPDLHIGRDLPECFELEPGKRLTLIWNAAEDRGAAQIDFVNDRELVVWPEGDIDGMEFLIDGLPAKERSWKFKHR